MASLQVPWQEALNDLLQPVLIRCYFYPVWYVLIRADGGGGQIEMTGRYGNDH